MSGPHFCILLTYAYGLLYVRYYFDRPIDNPVEVFMVAIASIAMLRRWR